jgi:glutathione synthase/RimK-type ligase-like ATP-grasp enzyme
VFGTDAIGAAISRTCCLARYLKQRIEAIPELELLAPVELNVVCFRYRSDESDILNRSIVIELQESGIVAPSTTMIDGRLAIRAAIVNHRTGQHEIDMLIDRTLALGASLSRNKRREEHPVPPRLKWLADLDEIEQQLLSDPGSIHLRFRRASLLLELGRLPEARADYLKVLEREPSHLEALNDLGRILDATRYRTAARTAFREAVTQHPNDPASRVNLGNSLLEESQRLAVLGQGNEALRLKREARIHFEAALRAKADYETAHAGLSYVLGELGDPTGAEHHRCAAFRNRYVIPFPYRGESVPIPVLLLMTPAGGNVPLQAFLDDRIFQTFMVIPEFYDPKVPLPAHQLIVNGIGDAEISPRALVAAQSLLSLTSAPIINPPSAVLATGRSDNAKRLSGLPGVVAPITVTLPRKQLSNPGAAAVLASHGFQFPLLFRAPGFHTGQNFLLVRKFEELSAALAQLPGQEIIVIQYLDARGRDGKSRKYRAMMIGGQIYPLHVAISSHWKIHYFTAEMADDPEHRAEDAAFLKNMPEVLGPVAMNALERIQSTLGLDYAGIDFALNARGEILLFEANATMAVIPPESDERWNYRRPAHERIRAAVQQMLAKRIHGGVQTMLRRRIHAALRRMLEEKRRSEGAARFATLH